MKNSLAFFGGKPTMPAHINHPSWPVITLDYERVVNEQMHSSMSIYNRSGIIEELEDRFAKIHNVKYALLNNSGTNSLWALYVGAQLQPGDEVLCPTYTFYATNTPLLSCGVTPVFCDVDENGNLDPNDLEHRITSKTKAIILTHMWGYPCDMDAISQIAKKHNLLLFEDCSHAHLARYKNKLVGTFGDGAAWSLQGQKNITGGEGGIVLTNNQEIYIRANLLGHYNKRCKDEIPSDHPLYRFALTGMGLKMRSHPLANAFALQQLKDHDERQEMRKKSAEAYTKLFSTYDFIELLDHGDSEPSWYAYIFKYKPEKSMISREEFVEMLHCEGLAEVDIPGSTGPNHDLPLFKEPHVLFPQFYSEKTIFNTNEEFNGAAEFYNSIVKLPTWTEKADEEILGYYLLGLERVLDYISAH